MNSSVLSTKDVASLVNTTETTIKRWAEQGKIPCSKTLGGHRKFLIKDVIAFAEMNGLPLTGTLKPSISSKQLEQLEFSIHTQNYGKIAGVLLEEVLQADREGILQILSYLYKHHIAFATITDEIVRPAMVHIGELWAEGKLEISEEHRGSQALSEALIRLGSELHHKPSNGKSAVLACPEGEHHDIGLRCLAYTLEAEGWKVYYVGTNTPFNTLSTFLRVAKPHAVFISTTGTKSRKNLIDGMHTLSRTCANQKAKLIVGGFYAGEYSTEELRCDHITSSVSDAIAYVRDVFHLKPGPKKK